jgi:hypothetical protein
MTNRDFRQRIADILTRQREERLDEIRAEVRAEKKPPATEKGGPRGSARRRRRAAS